MKIKVCGMKYSDNIAQLAQLPIHLMGMIFYSKSPRYIDKLSDGEIQSISQVTTHASIDRVGVFVNEDIETVKQMIDKYLLDMVQLHGNESPEYCKELNKIIPVIKAFSIGDASDLEQTKEYQGIWGYFLFDTKTSQYGGSGQKFDWSILNSYKGKTPFLLSGGITVEDAESIKAIKHPKFYGVDINSRFEIEPALKDIKQIQKFIKALKDE